MKKSVDLSHLPRYLDVAVARKSSFAPENVPRLTLVVGLFFRVIVCKMDTMSSTK